MVLLLVSHVLKIATGIFFILNPLRLLDCGVHSCSQICHEPPCKPCPTSASTTTCPCGSMKLDVIRLKCTDPIPTCLEKCRWILGCGCLCEMICHEGECGPCVGVKEENCRCGSRSVEVKCADRKQSGEDFVCRETCADLLNCRKHQCPKKCCVDKGTAHACELVCSRDLNCGQHKCKRTCHEVNSLH